MEKRKNDNTVIVITITIVIIVRQTKKKKDTYTRNKREQIMICCYVRAGWTFVLIAEKDGTIQPRVPNISQRV